MPDWAQLLKERLGSLGLAAGREDEILAELAAHLEDAYAGWVQRGVPAEEAVNLALMDVPDWAGLRREIYHAEHVEGDMNQRTKSLWLPGLLTSLLCMGLLFILQRFGPPPLFIRQGLFPAIVLNWPWYLFLPLAGACGAYCSRRAGGNIWGSVAAGLLPAAILAAALLSAFVVAFFVDPQVPPHVKFSALLAYLLTWGVFPGLALLLGVLPFLQQARGKAGA